MYLTKKIRRGWIVVNRKTGNHAHMKSEYGCYCILKFIKLNIIPDNPYLKESKRRLTQEREWRKDRYINIQKGVRE